jgi:hypothetical protein
MSDNENDDTKIEVPTGAMHISGHAPSVAFTSSASAQAVVSLTHEFVDVSVWEGIFDQIAELESHLKRALADRTMQPDQLGIMIPNQVASLPGSPVADFPGLVGSFATEQIEQERVTKDRTAARINILLAAIASLVGGVIIGAVGFSC